MLRGQIHVIDSNIFVTEQGWGAGEEGTSGKLDTVATLKWWTENMAVYR